MNRPHDVQHDPHDHAPLVEAWLKEPVWLPPSDTARLTQLVHQTPQQRHWWQRFFGGLSGPVLGATKLALASIILLVVGGFLLSAFLPSQDEVVPVPGQETPSAPATTATPSPSTEAPSQEPATGSIEPWLQRQSLTMVPGSGENVAGFAQVGRRATDTEPRFSELDDLQVVADRLVALSGGALLYSDDGQTWVPRALPPRKAEVLDLASTTNGLLASGTLKVDGEPQPALWSSPDGVTWTELPAPPRAGRIVSAEDPVALKSAGEIWLDAGDEGWVRVAEVPGMSMLRGPGGYLAWQGGGQEVVTPPKVLHWRDLQAPPTEVTLPEPLRMSGPDDRTTLIRIFALDDRWVMLGEESDTPDVIYTSTDGLEWQAVPRPPGMRAEDVDWLVQVGDDVVADGWVFGEDAARRGVWSWRLGEEVGPAETLAGSGDEHIDAPVPWRDGYVALGHEYGRDQFHTLWQMGGETAD